MVNGELWVLVLALRLSLTLKATRQSVVTGRKVYQPIGSKPFTLEGQKHF